MCSVQIKYNFVCLLLHHPYELCKDKIIKSKQNDDDDDDDDNDDDSPNNDKQLAPALRTPHYQGQFSLSQGKALIFSLNSTRLMRTPLNAENAMDTCFLPNQQIFMESQPR